MFKDVRIAAFAAAAMFAVGGLTAPSGAAEFVRGPLSPVDHVSLSPVSQQSAVRAARNYLNVMGFSRTGLINQLVSFDGFSTADATYAVDVIDPDWNQQAVKSATNYLNVMGFSRSGLINQLISFDGYTPEEAAYGVSAVGL